MPPPVIECIDLSKTYSKRITALNNPTLSINEGTSFGLLGFSFPTSGRVRVLGEELARGTTTFLSVLMAKCGGASVGTRRSCAGGILYFGYHLKRLLADYI